jgi:hypothetical protein
MLSCVNNGALSIVDGHCHACDEIAKPKPNTRKYINDPLAATGGHSLSNRVVKEALKK